MIEDSPWGVNSPTFPARVCLRLWLQESPRALERGSVEEIRDSKKWQHRGEFHPGKWDRRTHLFVPLGCLPSFQGKKVMTSPSYPEIHPGGGKLQFPVRSGGHRELGSPAALIAPLFKGQVYCFSS